MSAEGEDEEDEEDEREQKASKSERTPAFKIRQCEILKARTGKQYTRTCNGHGLVAMNPSANEEQRLDFMHHLGSAGRDNYKR